MATILNIGQRPSVHRWLQDAEARLAEAKRGGKASSIRAAEQAVEEVKQAIRQVSAVIIHCPRGCRYKAIARTEGRAVQAIAAHLVRTHFPMGAA